MPHSKEWAYDANGLRRFGLALVRDERFVVDDASAAKLVDGLIRQCCVGPISLASEACSTGRATAYARFIQLHRRYVRRQALEEDAIVAEPFAHRPSVVVGVRALPLELREALLLVSLARLSHSEAAQTLDLPLPRLVERLERARCRLAAHMGVDVDAGAATWGAASHLRVIK